MKELKSVDRKSLAKITALIYGLVGFFIAIVLAISTIINIVIKSDFEGSVILVVIFNSGAGLLLGVMSSLVTALIGGIIGYVAADIYNWFSKKVGGIKVELADSGIKPEDKLEKTTNNLF